VIVPHGVQFEMGVMFQSPTAILPPPRQTFAQQKPWHPVAARHAPGRSTHRYVKWQWSGGLFGPAPVLRAAVEARRPTTAGSLLHQWARYRRGRCLLIRVLGVNQCRERVR
jgi:hypothetical protein